MKKEMVYRWIFYILGLLILAMGLTLNAKTSLGMSPIISVAYGVSQITGWNFGNATMVWYACFVLAEIMIHISMQEKKRIPADLLQLPLSFVFTRFINLINGLLPEFKIVYAGSFWGSIGGRLLILAAAIILTGIGAALSLNARLVPNPGDGIVQAIADKIHKTTGLTKNFVDCGCAALSCVLTFAFLHRIAGLGIGSVCAMIGVGRVIAIWNHFTMKPIQKLSGLEKPQVTF